MFDTGYTNKLMEERSWLESILPHVENDTVQKEIRKKISTLDDKIVFRKKDDLSVAYALLNLIKEDDRLCQQFYEAFSGWKAGRDASK